MKAVLLIALLAPLASSLAEPINPPPYPSPSPSGTPLPYPWGMPTPAPYVTPITPLPTGSCAGVCDPVNRIFVMIQASCPTGYACPSSFREQGPCEPPADQCEAGILLTTAPCVALMPTPTP